MTWATECVFCEPMGHTDNPHHYLRNVEADRKVEGKSAHFQCARDAAYTIKVWNAGGVTITDDIVRWASNAHVPPTDCLGTMVVMGYITEAQRDASLIVKDTELRAFLVEARKNALPPSAEERYEARAAHGPGVELVNVITGRKWTT